MSKSINKNDILNKIIEKNPDYSKRKLSIVFNDIFEEISDELLAENNVRIKNFGTFEIKNINERTIKSIDGTIKTIPEHKKVSFKFSASDIKHRQV